MQPVLIIKAGSKLASLDSTPGDFEDWIAASFKNHPGQVVSVYTDERLPDCNYFSAIIVTGSSAMITDRTAWIETTAEWLRHAVRQSVPVLGICFGHQLLAYALGGEVADNPHGVEAGATCLMLRDAAHSDALFSTLQQPLLVNMSHKQAVIKLPPSAIPLAYTDKDQNSAFRFGESAWGIQFHPEFSSQVTAAYVEYYGLPPQDAKASDGCNAVDDDKGKQVLVNFINMPGSPA